MTSRTCSWTYRWVTSIMNHQTNLTGQHSSLCLQMLVIYITRPTASFNMSLQNTDSTQPFSWVCSVLAVTLSPWFEYLFIPILVHSNTCLFNLLVPNSKTACVLYRLLLFEHGLVFFLPCRSTLSSLHLWYSSGGGLAPKLKSASKRANAGYLYRHYIHIYIST